MTKIRNLVPWSGAHFSYMPDDILDIRDDIAQARQAAGVVEICRDQTIPTTGVSAPEHVVASPVDAPVPNGEAGGSVAPIPPDATALSAAGPVDAGTLAKPAAKSAIQTSA